MGNTITTDDPSIQAEFPCGPNPNLSRDQRRGVAPRHLEVDRLPSISSAARRRRDPSLGGTAAPFRRSPNSWPNEAKSIAAAHLQSPSLPTPNSCGPLGNSGKRTATRCLPLETYFPSNHLTYPIGPPIFQSNPLENQRMARSRPNATGRRVTLGMDGHATRRLVEFSQCGRGNP